MSIFLESLNIDECVVFVLLLSLLLAHFVYFQEFLLNLVDDLAVVLYRSVDIKDRLI
jgi:hypothetical protein